MGLQIRLHSRSKSILAKEGFQHSEQELPFLINNRIERAGCPGFIIDALFDRVRLLF